MLLVRHRLVLTEASLAGLDNISEEIILVWFRDDCGWLFLDVLGGLGEVISLSLQSLVLLMCWNLFKFVFELYTVMLTG